MNAELINLFQVSVPTTNTLPFDKVNLLAIPKGYLFEPSVCNQEALDFLDSVETNPNATFYKEWQDVMSRSEEHIMLEQMLHYLTAGTEFEFKPNDTDYSDVPAIKSLTVIRAITSDEMCERCMSLITSGAALKNETVHLVCDYLIECEYKFDVFSVANKEACSYICAKLNILPKNPFQLIRYILTDTIGDCLLIKDKNTIAQIKRLSVKDYVFDFNRLDEERIIALSSIFYRFKPIFLAFRNNHNNRAVINKIRRYAKTYHKPLNVPFWNTVLDSDCELLDVLKYVEDINMFKKIALVNTIDERLMFLPKKVYAVRNGATFIVDNDKEVDVERLTAIRDILMGSIIDNLRKKATTVRFPSNIILACPTSEKNFMGPYPCGTKIKTTGNDIFGIYWRNDWGTFDFDISYVDLNGKKIGWDGTHTSGDMTICHSGDIIDAPNGAAENIRLTGEYIPGIVLVNRYSGAENSKFRVYYAKGEDIKLRKGYMVNPENIYMSTYLISGIRKELAVGVVDNEYITVMNFAVGDRRTARGGMNVDYAKYYIEKSKTYLDLKTLLLYAGFVESDDAELDLSNPTSESIISIFS